MTTELLEFDIMVGFYAWDVHDNEKKLYKVTDILIANAGNRQLVSVVVCRRVYLSKQVPAHHTWGHEMMAVLYDSPDVNTKYCFSSAAPKGVGVFD
jgi:hypothetical protein